MLILIKHDSKKYAYDSESGALVPLSALQYRVAENLEFPLGERCPTTLRYQLAKYDSGDVKRAYDFIYGLYTAKILNGGNSTCPASLLLEGEYAVQSLELAKATLDAIYENLGDSTPISLLGNCDFYNELKKNIKA